VGSGLNLQGIGVDVEDVCRWEELLREIPAHQLNTLFTLEEQASCNAAGNRPAAYAGRWCAKEAVRKAINGLGKITLRDIAVVSAPDGAPLVSISNADAQLDLLDIRVSIAHSETTATAFAVVVRRQS
jgi:phosphopantetheine--protein transferase-like protein